MKLFVVLALCLVSAQASYLAHAPVVHAPAIAVAKVVEPIYQKSYIPQTVHLGATSHSYPVTEHRFTRTDYETPGATYAIPAVRTVQVTRPGYTTYINSAVTKAHVTNHQVAGPTITKQIIAPVVTKALAPVAVSHAAPVALGHGYAGDLGYAGHGGYADAGLGHGLY